jgi:hypothetical protein
MQERSSQHISCGEKGREYRLAYDRLDAWRGRIGGQCLVPIHTVGKHVVVVRKSL